MPFQNSVTSLSLANGYNKVRIVYPQRLENINSLRGDIMLYRSRYSYSIICYHQAVFYVSVFVVTNESFCNVVTTPMFYAIYHFF